MYPETREDILTLSTQQIINLVQQENKPRVGVFVPDGSRRLVLALTDLEPGTPEFYQQCAILPARYLRQSLQTLFEHGLPTVLVPILSRSVLNRGHDYCYHTALTGLKLIFAEEEWADFYKEYDVRVRVYGEKEQLTHTECAIALEWMTKTCRQTAQHQTHTLFYAIGESPFLGRDIARQSIAFFQKYGRIPEPEEQIQEYYGELLPPADFFIMTSKLSGLGALPRFLINGDTEIYFLPAAGAMGLNRQTYRLILFDLLFERAGLRSGIYGDKLEPDKRQALQAYYQDMKNTVIGLGAQIGNIWLPEIP